MSGVHEDPRVVAGMNAQLAFRRSRLESGEESLGWKIGFGGPEALKRLRTVAPLVGFLTDRALVSSGSTVSIAGWTKAVAEPEVAVYIGNDLEGGSDQDKARSAIAAVGPAIELADVRFAPDEVEAILADNIYQRHVVLGRRDTSRAGELDGVFGRVHKDGVLIAETDDPQALPGDLIDNVRHVANLLATFGEHLKAGEIIITGSIVPPIQVSVHTEILYELEPIGAVSVAFEP